MSRYSIEEILTWPSDNGWYQMSGVEIYIGDGASIGYNVRIGYDAHIGDDAHIGFNTRIGDGVTIGDGDKYLCIGPLGSRDAMLTLILHDGSITVHAGCFHGSADEFLMVVSETHGDDAHARAYRATIEYARALWTETVVAERKRKEKTNE